MSKNRFVQRFPSKEEMLFWDSIKSSTYRADFKAYLEQYPDGRLGA